MKFIDLEDPGRKLMIFSNLQNLSIKSLLTFAFSLLLVLSISIAGCGGDKGSDNPIILSTPSTGLPEINIKQGSIDIISGSGRYEFEDVNINNSSSIKFTIENKGTADLTITKISNGNPDQFSIDDSGMLNSIPGSSSTDFTVIFKPTIAQRDIPGSITIINNDINESSYTFTVLGDSIQVISFEDTNWNKSFDNDHMGDDRAESAAYYNGNLYVVGSGNKLVNENSNSDWWIKKFNTSDGTEITSNWNKKLDGGNNGEDKATSVAVDSSNVYVVGYIFNNSGNYDCWIKQFNTNGDDGWTKTIDEVLSGYNEDCPQSIAIDSDFVYVAGYSKNPSSSDWWLMKFDKIDGTQSGDVWNTTLHSGAINKNYALDVAIDSGNIYITGYGWGLARYPSSSWEDSSLEDWWIKKFDSSGTQEWSVNNADSSDSVQDIAYSIAIDSGNIYIAGTNQGDLSIKKFDTSGGTEIASNWNKKIDGNGAYDVAKSIVVDSADNVFVAGFGTNLSSDSSGYDWWIKKFSSNGNEFLAWDLKINGFNDGTTKYDEAKSIALDSSDNVFIVGYGANLVNEGTSYDWWIKKFLNE